MKSDFERGYDAGFKAGFEAGKSTTDGGGTFRPNPFEYEPGWMRVPGPGPNKVWCGVNDEQKVSVL